MKTEAKKFFGDNHLILSNIHINIGENKRGVKVRLSLNSEMFVFNAESNYFILYMYTFINIYYVPFSEWRSTTIIYVHNKTSIIRNILTLDICTNI
jgi:hypothetical protein